MHGNIVAAIAELGLNDTLTEKLQSLSLAWDELRSKLDDFKRQTTGDFI